MDDLEFTKLLREKTKANDPAFQFWVGRCYDLVESGIERNTEEAIKWYKLAVNQGYAPAQNNLGVIYYLGESIKQDCEKALQLFTLSSVQGNWRASANLAEYYRYGVDNDLNRAQIYYEKAIDQFDYALSPATTFESEELINKYHEIKSLLEDAKKESENKNKPERNEVFISYAHKDTKYKDELLPFIKMLEKTTKISWWADTKIKSGDKWEDEIIGAIARAKVIVVLVSQHFFASEYVWTEELPRILELADNEGATIMWIPIRTCPYKDTNIGKYQAVTDPKIPIISLNSANKDIVYTKLYEDIKNLFKEPATV
jgi:hypothetical protein